MYKDIIANNDNVKDTVNRLGVLNSLVLHSMDSARANTNAISSIFANVTINDTDRDIGSGS